jgi:eukaryotic-like serine/threonine-protein kinase
MPHKLGPYEIRREIGSGGMGVVYEGWDARLARRVAVKTLWPALAQRAEARERFLREARAAAAVSHPNVTQIYDIGEEDGVVYFAMEFLDAPSLQQTLAEERTLAPRRIVAIARQAALGLRAAAERGIVHRDVKPSNLVLVRDGTVKVTDFGLAKQSLVDGDLTLEGQTIGTPKYLSPEQASGGAVDVRSDIYSLGVTMYEMLAGRPPFEGATPMEIMLKHVREPIPPLQQVLPSAPRALAALIQSMLSKQPAARPQSYDELIRSLDRIAQPDPAHAGARTLYMPRVASEVQAPSPAPARSSGFAGRLFAVVLVGIALAVGLGLALRSISSGRGEPVDRPAASRLGQPAEDQRPADPAVRVPTPAPAPDTPMLERLPASEPGAELRIVDTRHEFTEDGRMIVTGSIENTGSSLATRTKVRVSLTDTSGAVLTTTDVVVQPERISSGERGHFEAVFRDPGQSVQILFELNWVS